MSIRRIIKRGRTFQALGSFGIFGDTASSGSSDSGGSSSGGGGGGGGSSSGSSSSSTTKSTSNTSTTTTTESDVTTTEESSQPTTTTENQSLTIQGFNDEEKAPEVFGREFNLFGAAFGSGALTTSLLIIGGVLIILIGVGVYVYRLGRRKV